LGVQAHIQAVRASRGGSRIQGVDDHAKDRESGSFDIGRLGADQGRDGLDGRFIGLGGLQRRQDAGLNELCSLHHVLRCDGKGMLYARN
jgi:hypothetical protein